MIRDDRRGKLLALEQMGSDRHATVELRFETWESRNDRDETSIDVPVTALQGVTPEQLRGSDGPIEFRVVRDAGTFVCQGRGGRGRAAGTFDFAPNAAYAAALSQRGLQQPTSAQQFQLALYDISYAFLDELKAEGYRPPQIDDLIAAGQHGVDLDFVKGLDSLGYRVGEIESLVELRDHGVDPHYVRALAAVGYTKLSTRVLLELRDHGVDAHYINEMGRAGFASASTDDLLAARDHGVKGRDASAYRDMGYDHSHDRRPRRSSRSRGHATICIPHARGRRASPIRQSAD